VREGEIINCKHWRFVSRFEPFALRPRLHHYEGFHYNRSRKITQWRNTYNELLQELLDPQVPHLFPQEQHTRTRNLYNSSKL